MKLSKWLRTSTPSLQNGIENNMTFCALLLAESLVESGKNIFIYIYPFLCQIIFTHQAIVSFDAGLAFVVNEAVISPRLSVSASNNIWLYTQAHSLFLNRIGLDIDKKPWFYLV